MSSSYDVLCLAHDPPLSASDCREYTVEKALACVWREHTKCSLVLIEYSGGPVAIGCPPHSKHPRDVRWMDLYWARLVEAVLGAPHDGAMEQLLDRLPGRHCWDAQQIRKIVRAVGGEPA